MLQKTLPAICILAVCLFFYNEPVTAQSRTPRFEVGAQFSLIRFTDLDITEPGFGGRFTYNFNEYIAVEAEGSFFPRAVKGPFEETLQGGRKTLGLFGVKLGSRGKRVGVFGKFRPGFVHFSDFERNGSLCVVQGTCPPNAPPRFSETDLALDLGGVVEFYPTRRIVVRFDVGDTLIHSGSGENILVPDTFVLPNGTTFPTVRGIVRSTSHNLQFSTGIGFRF